MQINVTFDSSVNSAPAGFVAAVNYVVQYYESLFTNPVTINIDVGYGEVDGQPMGNGALGESETFLDNFTYSQIRSAEIAGAISSNRVTAAASLPATDPTGGGHFWLSTAEARALGLIGASSAVDGYVGFSSTAAFTYNPNDRAVPNEYDFIGTVEHEISEVMGRMLLVGGTIGGTSNSYDLLDLFHYSSAGNRDFTGTRAGYFSFDGGNSDLNNFNTNPNGDFGDWAASAGNDLYLAFSNIGVENAMSRADIAEMNVLGWDVATPLTVVGTGNFTGNATDAMSDILFKDNGTLATWLMNGATGTTREVIYSGLPSTWQVAGVGDFNGDGHSDILLLNTNGTFAMWEMNGSQILAGAHLPSLNSSWQVAGVGDFNGDGHSDILLLNTNGTFAMWEMNGSQIQSGAYLPSLPSGWQIAGVGDFTDNGHSDILLLNTNGTFAMWEMNGTQIRAGGYLASLPSTSGWNVTGVGDFNGDGMSDILLQNTNGSVAIWEMNGTQIQAGAVIGSMTSAWHIVGVGDFNGDHMSDILWQNNDGALEIWQMNGLQVTALTVVPPSGAPIAGAFSATSAADASNGSAGVLASQGAASILSQSLGAGDGHAAVLQAANAPQLLPHSDHVSSEIGLYASGHIHDLV